MHSVHTVYRIFSKLRYWKHIYYNTRNQYAWTRYARIKLMYSRQWAEAHPTMILWKGDGHILLLGDREP